MSLQIKNNISSINSLRHLSNSESQLAQSLERLASGQKINSAGEDPAGLIISENLRAQVAGIEQAINNSEFTISMVQTAEGALTEVANLLIQGRQLALAAANEGGNDTDTLLALQEQIRNALESIDRVSAETRFGNKHLLDGSRGVSGIASGNGLSFIGASEKTVGSPVEGYDVEVTRFAEQSFAKSSFDDSLIPDLQLSLSEGGKSVTVMARTQDTADSFASRLNEKAQTAGLNVDVIHDQEAGSLTVRHREAGSQHGFVVSSSKADVLASEAGVPELINNGQDIAGTINGESATGEGDVLTGNRDNRTTDGLSVRYQRENNQGLGAVGTVSVAQNAMTFQIGPNHGQTVNVAIDDTSTSSLARGIDNHSGFASLSDVNITTPQGAQDSILFLDEAIGKVSKIRGRLGAFQRNSLESNVATLRVTAENLLAAESSIRDTDVAQELANFTKHQILTQSSAATVAQANNVSRQAAHLLERGLLL